MAVHDDLARLQAFFDRPLEMMTLAGVTFYINPQSYEQDTETVHTDVVTYGGIGRFDFGVHATSYRLQGTTGTAGWPAMDRMRVFDPYSRSGPPQPVGFTYPGHFKGIRHVYVDRFRKTVSAETGPLYVWFDITLTEYPGHSQQPAIALVDANSLGLTLPPGG